MPPARDPAGALVVDMLVMLGQRGYEPALTPANWPHLLQLSGEMLTAFGLPHLTVSSTPALPATTAPAR